MSYRKPIFIVMAGILLFVLVGVVYSLPPVHNRLAWRIEGVKTKIIYALNPPDQVVFIPQDPVILTPQVETPVSEPSATATPTGTATATVPGPTLTPTPTFTPEPSPTPTFTHTPLPDRVVLSGIKHEYQSFNNCGPANLSMALSYWGWLGDQRDTRNILRPLVDDYNVMPEEMVAYVESYTDFGALMRVGGDLVLMKRFVAAGFPLIIEKGLHPKNDWWMGHYLVVSGYDDTRRMFITQDSLVMADYPLSYDYFEGQWWRDFNYVFIVIFPFEREAEVLDLLGPFADQTESYRIALQRAMEESEYLTGRDLFFAWYNIGTNFVGLEEYAAAAEAYDKAFSLYAALPDKERPWRMLWYQIGPYPAYYHTGRYQDVINLANTTLSMLTKHGLEESYYWRGLAHEALGNSDGALSDLKRAVQLNPNFSPPREKLLSLGVEP
jgi:hypothetical protein